MAKKVNPEESFQTSAANLIETVLDLPIDDDQKQMVCRIIDNMRSSFSAAVDDKDNLISSLLKSVDRLQQAIKAGCVESEIDTGVGTIGYKADNLQDEQVMELLEDLLKKNGSYSVLRALESLNI
ncbi:MAG TPA: hypothetical protein VEV15_13530 [Flavisolibacter sp.]|nr:hypothetical protein [Flavisolibacter sp.]